MTTKAVCFYCRKKAPCLCEGMINHISRNVNREVRTVEAEAEQLLRESEDFLDSLSPHTKVIDAEYPRYE